jgi:hypothetical protein
MTQIDQTGEISWRSTPVPAARASEHFSAAEVGDGEYVFLDNERLEYHTLNASAFAVWKLCDGVRTSEEISRALARTAMPLPVEAIDLAVAELGEAGLLASVSHGWNVHVTRRRVVKLAAAGVLGVAIIPAVSSITAPTAAAAISPDGVCGPADVCIDGSGGGNDYCCCAPAGSSTGICTKKNQCSNCLHE